MSCEASVTLWIQALRQGDAEAAELLWQRYFRQLMNQARQKMSSVNTGSYDEEDAALSTFRILCSKLQQGHYSALADRGELWQLMLTILTRKVGHRYKYHQASKRAGPIANAMDNSTSTIPATTVAEISQECFDLIASLKDPNLEQVALLKFEGYTNEEIAEKLQRTRRTIQRMLNLIRDLWQEELSATE